MRYGVEVRVVAPDAYLWADPKGAFWHVLCSRESGYSRPIRWTTRGAADAWAEKYYRDWPGIYRVVVLREKHLTKTG